MRPRVITEILLPKIVRSDIILVLIVLFGWLGACTPTMNPVTSTSLIKGTSYPDYSIINNWAVLPANPNGSEKYPLNFENGSGDTLADVFFIHPTSYTQGKMTAGWNADLNDETVNNKTDKGSIIYQASVFNKNCNIYAPRYRQAHLQAFYTSDKKRAQQSLDLAYQDVKAAFEYYLSHYNNGRPMIIASHSQGTYHAKRLLSEFFENKVLRKQLVCAYLIGWPIFEDSFSSIHPCADSSSTACIVSWRTYQEGFVDGYIQNEQRKAIVTNPLTWTMDTALAPASMNKGGILRNFNKLIPELVHAQIHGNVLWVNKPQFFGNIFLKTKNYHIADYNLFYQNIKMNVGTRIQAFLVNKKSE